MSRKITTTSNAWSGFDWLSTKSRSMGLVWASGKGTGKSRGLGRDLMWRDFLNGVGQVLIEPAGGACDNFLSKLIEVSARLPPEKQQELWQRVRYLDMSGQSGYVTGWPLYYRLGAESLFAISQRFLDTLIRIDPNLQAAAVEGWNALWTIGTNAGMVLAALGYQITEAEDLLRNPKQWRDRLNEARACQPEVAPAVDFFEQEYLKWRPEIRTRKTASLLNKIQVFSLDPVMRAMFGAGKPGLDLNEVVEQGLTVLIDFRGVTDMERQRFQMMWVFQYILAFIKERGIGRHKPLSICIDELPALTNQDKLAGNELFANDLDSLANLWARNASIWYCFCFQQVFQLSPLLIKTLLSSGNLVFGTVTDGDSALELSQHLFPYLADRVKYREPIYAGMPPRVIDYRTVYFSIQEQREIAATALRQLGKFRFLCRPAPAEGEATGRLQAMTLEYLDPGRWVDEEKTYQARRWLAGRDGLPIEQVSPNNVRRQTGETPVGATSAPPRRAPAKVTEPPIRPW